MHANLFLCFHYRLLYLETTNTGWDTPPPTPFVFITSNQKVAPLYQKKCTTVFFCPLLLQMAFFSFSFRTPEYEEGYLGQKRAKEDSDALFLIQRSHFLVTSVWRLCFCMGDLLHTMRSGVNSWENEKSLLLLCRHGK